MGHSSEFEQLRKVQQLVNQREEQEKLITQKLILSGKHILELGLVQNLHDQDQQVQPAGIDFTLKQLASFVSAGVIDFDNSNRQLPEYERVEYTDNLLKLSPGAYLVEFNERVSLPTNIIGIMRTRSSVFRSGATLTAGVIDPGYSGATGALLQVWNTNGITLSRDAKLVQWVFAEVNNPIPEGYQGVYKDATGMF